MSTRPGTTSSPRASMRARVRRRAKRPGRLDRAIDAVVEQEVPGARRCRPPDRRAVPPAIDQPIALTPVLRPPAPRLLAPRRLGVARVLGLAARDEQVEQRHAHRHAVGHLVHDHRVRARRRPSLEISMPRLIGPGCRMIDVAAWRRRRASAVEAEVARVLVERREEVGALPLALDAQHHDDVGVAHASPRGRDGARDAELRELAGRSVGGPTRRTRRAERAAGACRFERATRLCRMSPTMATVEPGDLVPAARGSCSRSSSACVGCSWLPSPALMIGQLDVRARAGARAPEDGGG